MIMCKRRPLNRSRSPFFALLPTLIQLRVLCLSCAAIWPWPTWRMSNFVASGLAHHQRLENATQQDILFMQNIKIHIYIFMFDCMCWCVCVGEADPSSRQQLNLSVVRKCGSVVCCQTNGESEYTKKAKHEADSSQLLAWISKDTLAKYLKH